MINCIKNSLSLTKLCKRGVFKRNNKNKINNNKNKNINKNGSNFFKEIHSIFK